MDDEGRGGGLTEILIIIALVAAIAVALTPYAQMMIKEFYLSVLTAMLP